VEALHIIVAAAEFAEALGQMQQKPVWFTKRAFSFY
jgi:hypothetical protein